MMLGTKDEWKEEMWKEQQAILKRRRSGGNKKYFEDVAQRRKDAAESLRKKEEARERGDDIGELKNNLGPDGVERKGGIPIPIASFGLPLYDQGERFDLRSKYVENPKVDDTADWKNVFFGNNNNKKQDKKPDEKKKTTESAFKWPWEQ